MVVLRAEARFDEGAGFIFIMMIGDGGENWSMFSVKRG